MDFQTAVRTCFQKYATFEGRASRPEYWWFVLFYILCNFLLSGIDRIVFPGSQNDVLALLFSIGMILPCLAVAVRRLHDCDKTGWLFMIILLPLVGWMVLLYFYTQPGTTGRNRFGENPVDHTPGGGRNGGQNGGDDRDGGRYHKSSIPDISDD